MNDFSPKRIHEWTAAYEQWLATRLPSVVAADIEKKHADMTESAFVFLRATYYAWARLWPSALPELAEAPTVAAVGDLHFENFGTWRDDQGRLAWGINDFDEASELPYTNDLVRLATSVALASADEKIGTSAPELSRTFLASYRECLEEDDGQPVLFGEEHRKLEALVLRDLIQKRQDDEEESRKRKGKKDKHKKTCSPPADCRKALEAALPGRAEGVTFQPRVAGVGSLGRPRFEATRMWKGGEVRREAKARAPSAAIWATAEGAGTRPFSDHFADLLKNAVRSPDPFLHLVDGWVIRRLTADSGKIKIDTLPHRRELELAALMGQEVANVHHATKTRRKAILEHLDGLERKKPGWLLEAARRMAELTEKSYKVWKKNPTIEGA